MLLRGVEAWPLATYTGEKENEAERGGRGGGEGGEKHTEEAEGGELVSISPWGKALILL